MRCWRYDKTQTIAELNHISETLWRKVSRNTGDKLRITYNCDTSHFMIWRDGHSVPLASVPKRRGVEKIMRRHYYNDVLYHGTD